MDDKILFHLECSRTLIKPQATDLQRSTATEMYKAIDEYFDVVPPLNLAMRDSGCADEPRRGVKSDFFKALNSVVCTTMQHSQSLQQTNSALKETTHANIAPYRSANSMPFYVDSGPPVLRTS